MPRYWQDLSRTIPAVCDGDPVAVMECDSGIVLVQPSLMHRPTLRNCMARLDGADDSMLPKLPPPEADEPIIIEAP